MNSSCCSMVIMGGRACVCVGVVVCVYQFFICCSITKCFSVDDGLDCGRTSSL